MTIFIRSLTSHSISPLQVPLPKSSLSLPKPLYLALLSWSSVKTRIQKCHPNPKRNPNSSPNPKLHIDKIQMLWFLLVIWRNNTSHNATTVAMVGLEFGRGHCQHDVPVVFVDCLNGGSRFNNPQLCSSIASTGAQSSLVLYPSMKGSGVVSRLLWLISNPMVISGHFQVHLSKRIREPRSRFYKKIFGLIMMFMLMKSPLRMPL